MYVYISFPYILPTTVSKYWPMGRLYILFIFPQDCVITGLKKKQSMVCMYVCNNTVYIPKMREAHREIFFGLLDSSQRHR